MGEIIFDRSAESGAKPGAPLGEPGRAMLKRMNVTHGMLRTFAFSYISWKDKMTILDVGCGGGAAINEMLKKADDCKIYGLDHMEDSIKLASEVNASELNKRVFLQQGDVEQLPYEDKKFDLITAFETVYFWPDIQKAFDEAYRTLAEGGEFAATCEASNPDTIGWPKIEGTFHIYRPWELAEFMFRSGFKEITIHLGEAQTIAVIGTKVE